MTYFLTGAPNVKIAIYAIAKNEANHVYRWYESVKEADVIYVLDTGSTDSTVSKLEKCGVNVSSINKGSFRFDAARNMALSLVPDGYFAVWLDMDEVLEEGWCDKLRTILTSGSHPHGVNFRLIFTTNPDGSPAITYDRLSGHIKEFYSWRYHAHEILIANGEDYLEYNSDIKCYHLPDMDKPRDYLTLLKASAYYYRDARSTRYYARELMNVGDTGAAIAHYLDAANMEQSNHILSEIYGELGSCYEQSGLHPEAKNAYLYSAWASPDIREGWSKLAAYCWRTGDIYGCISASIQMQYITQKPENGVIRDESLYAEWPDHMLALCHHHLGNMELAQEYITKAFNTSPQNIAVAKDMILICNIPVTET